MITKDQVLEQQKFWGDGVIKIGSLKETPKECKSFAQSFLEKLYNFQNGTILFKPTKCAIQQFRKTLEDASSYFIGDVLECLEGVEKKCVEDQGFATNTPWKEIRFENSDMILENNRAIAMGNYFFIDFEDKEIKVEYTFGYKLINNELKIDLHHSSLPYNPQSVTGKSNL